MQDSSETANDVLMKADALRFSPISINLKFNLAQIGEHPTIPINIVKINSLFKYIPLWYLKPEDVEKPIKDLMYAKASGNDFVLKNIHDDIIISKVYMCEKRGDDRLRILLRYILSAINTIP